MKNELKALVEFTIHELALPSLQVSITRPEDSKFGEYTTNAAFILGKQLHENPIALATRIVTYLKDQIISINDAKASDFASELTILQDIKDITIAGPGFVNFTVHENKFSKNIDQVLKDKERFGKVQKTILDSNVTNHEGKEKIVIEFTDPNPFKTLHIGHLYSNAVGESLARLLETTSSDVHRLCYQGDVGLHVAKALWGMFESVKEQKMSASDTLTTYEHKTLEERVAWLGQSYAVGSTAFEENETAKKEIKYINILAFIAAQQLHQEAGIAPVIDYSRLLSDISESPLFSQDDISLLYKTGRKWSLDYFEKQYERLGTKFEGYYFESMVAESGYQIVKQHIADGIFEESDGAVVYKGEKKGLHTRVFINQLGLPTYEAKELGLAPKKYQDWMYDRSIIITAKEIDEYFKVLLAALGETNPELARKTTHMSHGVVKLPEGKMSSRKGNILTAEWLLDETKASISTLIDQNGSYSSEEKEEIAEKATLAAVKYSLLKVSLPSDILFDIKKSVSMEGDSGPYLLYTYARCRSIERKNTEQMHGKGEGTSMGFNPEEHALARLMLYYPEIVAEAATGLSPSTIARYLIDLAQSFNVFYAKHQILEGSQREFRLALTAATAQILQNGLHLLGIKTVERM